MSIFTNRIGWAAGMVMDNLVIVVIAVVLAVVAFALYPQRIFLCSGRQVFARQKIPIFIKNESICPAGLRKKIKKII